METNVVGKIKDAVTSKLAGFPEQRRKVISNLEKGEQKENEEKTEKHFLEFLENKEDLIKIYKIIKL